MKRWPEERKLPASSQHAAAGMIADLARRTGRFNLMLGAIATAFGIAAALSQVIAGSIVHHAGYRAGTLSSRRWRRHHRLFSVSSCPSRVVINELDLA